jgi:glycosyltransferase involved in cell wall biosynthesis
MSYKQLDEINFSKIRLHIPAIPYTITTNEYSHDAFTGKVKRFSPMMRSVGFEVYHYGVETSETGATKDIQLMTKDEWTELRIKSLQYLDPKLSLEEAIKKNSDPTMVPATLSNWTTPLTKEFNKRFREKLVENYRKNTTDIVCLPLAKTYIDALNTLKLTIVEFGIGYDNSYHDFRIFESYSWMANTLATQKKEPSNYWFVIPHAFDTREFKLCLTPTPLKVGFLGRLGTGKGCGIIVEIARRFPTVQFILCGAGDPAPFLNAPNIVYKAPIHGEERSDYLGSCVAVLCLSKYFEPFGCCPVEAQLCGTPVISTDWGGMVETVEQGKTGLRGHTLADFCYGIQMALDGKFDRTYIRDRAVRMFDMYNLAHNYEYVFKSILDISNGNGGWYSKNTYINCVIDK